MTEPASSHSPIGKPFLKYTLVTISFVIIALHLFLGVDSSPFHGDESGWISAGYYYYQLMFIDHNVNVESWARKDFYAFGIVSPPVGKYLIGMAMHAFLPRGEYTYQYHFGKSESENAQLGNIPPPEVLRPTRLLAALFSLGTCSLLFWYCTKIWNWLVGVSAAFILSFNSLFTLFAQRAMTDAYIIFFFMLAQVCCIALYNRWNNKKAFLFVSALSGIVAGLSAGTKLNGMIVMLYTWILIVYLLAVGRGKAQRSVLFYIASGVLTMICAIITFAILNPVFYTFSPAEFFDRLTLTVDRWNELIAHQQKIFPEYAIHGTYSVILSRISMDYFHVVFFCFAIVGIIRAGSHVVRAAARKQANIMLNPIVFFLVNVIILGLWIPLDWDRYYLPIILAEVPVAAYGLFEVADIILPKLTRRLISPAKSTVNVKARA